MGKGLNQEKRNIINGEQKNVNMVRKSVNTSERAREI